MAGWGGAIRRLSGSPGLVEVTDLLQVDGVVPEQETSPGDLSISFVPGSVQSVPLWPGQWTWMMGWHAGGGWWVGQGAVS